MFCPNCGKELSGSEKFCPSCGKEVKQISEKTNTKTISTNEEKKDDLIEVNLNNRIFLKDSKDRLFTKCCHYRVGELDTSCPKCGKSIMSIPTTTTNNNSNSNYETPNKRSSYEKEYGGSYGRAVASMILGICGLVFTFFLSGPGLICAIVGACLGSPYEGGCGKAGKIMSWIAIITCAIALLITCSIAAKLNSIY